MGGQGGRQLSIFGRKSSRIWKDQSEVSWDHESADSTEHLAHLFQRSSTINKRLTDLRLKVVSPTMFSLCLLPDKLSMSLDVMDDPVKDR
jgi:hypothetical protein